MTETIKYIAPPRRKRVAGGRPVLVQTRLTAEQAEKLDRLAMVYGSGEGLPLTRAAVLALVLDAAPYAPSVAAAVDNADVA